ncbi:NPCBM/NEW2 domain-containing protein [Salinifilum aidingensis]
MISRRGAILAAAITGVCSLIVGLTTTYVTTRPEQSPPPATETVTRTATETVTPSGSASPGGEPASPPPAGAVHLADREPVEGASGWERGKATVRNREHERALVSDDEICSVVTAAYNIDPGTSTFHSRVGLADDAESGEPVTFTVLVDGEPAGNSATVEVGEVAELTAQVDGAFRVTVQAEPKSCMDYPVLIDPTLRP